MIEIIQEAITTFNLSSLEEYYIDSDNRIRARGFIYDEDTGIFVNENGLLELGVIQFTDNQERVRELFRFEAQKPISIISLDTTVIEEKIALEEAVA